MNRVLLRLINMIGLLYNLMYAAIIATISALLFVFLPDLRESVCPVFDDWIGYDGVQRCLNISLR